MVVYLKVEEHARAVRPCLLSRCKHSTFERMISGARYSGVPHSVHVRPLILFAKPKSVIYTYIYRKECGLKGVGWELEGVG